MCSTVFNLYNVYDDNYNNNCLFGILLTRLFSILFTMEIFKTRLFCLHATSYLCVPLFSTYTTYTTTTIIITACSVFVSHAYSLFCSQWRSPKHDCFVYTQLHIRLTEFLLLTVACFVLFFAHVFSLMKILEVECSCFALSRILLRLPCCLYSVCYVRIFVYHLFFHACAVGLRVRCIC